MVYNGLYVEIVSRATDIAVVKDADGNVFAVAAAELKEEEKTKAKTKK